MNRSDNNRRTVIHLIKEFGESEVLNRIDYFEEIEIYTPERANDLRYTFYKMMSRPKKFTKYKKFHMNQSRFEVEQ